MAKSQENNNEPVKPDWDKFAGLIEVGDPRIGIVARALERAGPAATLAVVAVYLEGSVQTLAIALAGTIGVIQSAAELVRLARVETPHDLGTKRRRKEGA